MEFLRLLFFLRRFFSLPKNKSSGHFYDRVPLPPEQQGATSVLLALIHIFFSSDFHSFNQVCESSTGWSWHTSFHFLSCSFFHKLVLYDIINMSMKYDVHFRTWMSTFLSSQNLDVYQCTSLKRWWTSSKPVTTFHVFLKLCIRPERAIVFSRVLYKAARHRLLILQEYRDYKVKDCSCNHIAVYRALQWPVILHQILSNKCLFDTGVSEYLLYFTLVP